jgi:hypothetical protein
MSKQRSQSKKTRGTKAQANSKSGSTKTSSRASSSEEGQGELDLNVKAEQILNPPSKMFAVAEGLIKEMELGKKKSAKD